MITTKHDLCANTAKFNLNELIETAKIAVSRCRRDCEQSLRETQERQLTQNWEYTYGVASSACELAESAKALAQASNTLHYLIQSKTRGEIIVVK